MSNIRVGCVTGFHPRMLSDAVKMQAAEFEWLPAVLESCGDGEWESMAYVGYVSRKAERARFLVAIRGQYFN